MSACYFVKLSCSTVPAKGLFSVYLTYEVVIKCIWLAEINLIFNFICLLWLYAFLRELVEHVDPYEISHGSVHLVSFKEL